MTEKLQFSPSAIEPFYLMSYQKKGGGYAILQKIYHVEKLRCIVEIALLFLKVSQRLDD